MIRLTRLVHDLLQTHLRPGGRALDLTAGNGHDTAAMARAVGPDGRVWAFDVQDQALQATRRRLDAEGLALRVTLIQADHKDWPHHAPEAACGLDAAVANLGYLPGGDKSTVTCAASSVPALEAAWNALRPGGLQAVTIYRGHPGGAEEDAAISAWAAGLPDVRWHDPSPPHGPRLLVACRPDTATLSAAESPHR